MDVNSLFESSLEQLPNFFKPNQLAYYTLTSKPEGALRDAIAFNMHVSINDESFVVSREWKKTDLVVLDDHRPLLIAEFKCAYTFDCMDNNPVGTQYGVSVIKDLDKSMLYATDVTSIYACLFLIHPKGKLNNVFSQVAKYYRRINDSLYECTEDVLRQQAIKNMSAYFSRWNIAVSTKQFSCGSAYGIAVDILTLTIGPMTKHQIAGVIDKGII